MVLLAADLRHGRLIAVKLGRPYAGQGRQTLLVVTVKHGALAASVHPPNRFESDHDASTGADCCHRLGSVTRPQTA